MAWLEKAGKSRGKAPLAVALAIRFASGRKDNVRSVRLPNPLVAKLGVSRKSKYAALKVLQTAGLIHVNQEPKKAPMVTIIEYGWREG
jgi:hypothetical protein